MENHVQAMEFSQSQVDLIKRQICVGASDDELALFINVCKRMRLDPFCKQIFAVKRWDSKAGREVMAIQVSVDGRRLVAERSGLYQGQTGPFWCGKDGVWKDLWIGVDNEPYPFAAKVGVLKVGFREPLWAVARFDAYKQTFKDKGSGQMRLSPMWEKFPDLMIGKCAEDLALRRGFPLDVQIDLPGQQIVARQDDLNEKVKIMDQIKAQIPAFVPNVQDNVNNEKMVKEIKNHAPGAISRSRSKVTGHINPSTLVQEMEKEQNRPLSSPEAPKPPPPEQPKPPNQSAALNFKISFGKFSGKMVSEVDPKELKSYAKWFEGELEKAGKNPLPSQKEFLDIAKDL